MVSISTKLAQLGNRKDSVTGSVSLPIHPSTTYAHPAMGESTGFDYTRTANPTRSVLEEGLADLEGGTYALATSSGMSAIQLVLQLFPKGSKILASRDLYGGSYRLFEDLEKADLLTFEYFLDEAACLEKLDASIDAVYLETPTNPLMQVLDIEAIAQACRKVDACLIVDNTLLTPLRQKPLELGADIVVHSGTKYLTGHNDILAGVVVTNDADLGERLVHLANATGPTLSAFDAWLFVRSLKTLEVRFDRQEATARQVVSALEALPGIEKVLYAGQGAMLSVLFADQAQIKPFLENLQVFSFAESLGSVESLVTYPTTQTHADIPEEVRESYGLTPNLLRFSIGLEDPEDLIHDIKQALQA